MTVTAFPRQKGEMGERTTWVWLLEWGLEVGRAKAQWWM